MQMIAKALKKTNVLHNVSYMTHSGKVCKSNRTK